MSKYNTIQQHEPLRVPEKWSGEERRLIAQLEEILDDLYRRFNRLRVEDLSPQLQTELRTDHAVIEALDDKISLAVSGKLDADDPSVGVVNSALLLDSTGVHILTGGVFTVDSGNFTLDEEGHITITDAMVTGTLKSGGNNVLTDSDIIVSSSTPSNPESGMIWVKPANYVSVKHICNVTSSWSFNTFTSGQTMSRQGASQSGSGSSFSYSLKIPYTINNANVTARTVNATVTDGTNTVTFTGTLSNTKGAHTIVLTQTSSVWFGTKSTLTIRMTLSASGVSNPYSYHSVTGNVELTEATAGSASGGWNDAQIKIYK